MFQHSGFKKFKLIYLITKYTSVNFIVPLPSIDAFYKHYVHGIFYILLRSHFVYCI